ncbi:MAG: hypothetical protein F6J87_08320 [Spirulina sp. SIO3F2]|nr:hypothetical protein [Spirulina sp. SIO3F2]
MIRQHSRGAIALYSSLIISTVGMGLGVIASPPAAAYLIIQNLELQGRAGDTYESFMTRAQTIAATAVQRNFEGDLLASEVSITVNGRNNSMMTAVLRLRVTRRDWQRYPDARYWITYFPSAEMLLGFPRGGTAPTPVEPELPEFPE